MHTNGTDMALNGRDFALLHVLTHKVRTLSLPQIARTWWADSTERAARDRVLKLEQAGLLTTYSVLCHPEIRLPAPVISWSPGEPEPDFGAASYQLKSRWRLSPTCVLCVSATTLAGRIMGGHGGRTSRESEQTHDIHLAAVFLQLRETNPKEAKHWVSEEAVRARRSSRGEKIPDARIDLRGRERIVEFGGAYPKGKLSLFHDYCAYKASAYEVW